MCFSINPARTPWIDWKRTYHLNKSVVDTGLNPRCGYGRSLLPGSCLLRVVLTGTHNAQQVGHHTYLEAARGGMSQFGGAADGPRSPKSRFGSRSPVSRDGGTSD